MFFFYQLSCTIVFWCISKQLSTKFDIFTVLFYIVSCSNWSSDVFSAIRIQFYFGFITIFHFCPFFFYCSITDVLLHSVFVLFDVFFWSMMAFLLQCIHLKLLLHSIFLTLWVNTSVVMVFFIKLFYELLILGQILITSQAFFHLLCLISKVYLIFFFYI